MDFLYCFYNASLTQRVLAYLAKKLRSVAHCVTVIFLNDYWVVQIKITTSVDADQCLDIRAFLEENGVPYQPCDRVQCVLDELLWGNDITDVMNRHQIAIVSHGRSQFRDIQQFQKAFVSGLGYCPPSLA